MYAFPTTDRHETPLGKPFAVLVETMTTLVDRRKFVTHCVTKAVSAAELAAESKPSRDVFDFGRPREVLRRQDK